MIKLSVEQLQLAKLIQDYANSFHLSVIGDEKLLQKCHDYIDAFKQMLGSSSRIQIDYICQQYSGFFCFARIMEIVAQGIADGVIKSLQDY